MRPSVWKQLLIVCLLVATPGQWAAAGILPKDSAEQYELTFWNSIKDSSYPEDYEHYLKAYPKGRFSALARSRIARLRAAAPKPESSPTTTAPATPAPKSVRKAVRPSPAAAKASPPAAEQPVEPVQTGSPLTTKVEPAPTPANFRVFQDCPNCPALIELPKAVFPMGSDQGADKEAPLHAVAIGRIVAIGKYEVTVGQWDACADAGACQPIGDELSVVESEPVRNVNWDDAQRYVQWLRKSTGKPYRLPTEAEWEYAARGGTGTPYWWGKQMEAGKANCKDCGGEWSQEEPAEVGSYPANPYGFHDTSGSVWEWVSDCWHSSYMGAPPDGSNWDEPGCQMRVIRGGSWRDGANAITSSSRLMHPASVRDPQNGFRVARDIVEQPAPKQ